MKVSGSTHFAYFSLGRLGRIVRRVRALLPGGDRSRVGGGRGWRRLIRPLSTVESRNNCQIGNYSRVIVPPTVVVRGPPPTPTHPGAPRANGLSGGGQPQRRRPASAKSDGHEGGHSGAQRMVDVRRL